jgi:hypothetical protein
MSTIQGSFANLGQASSGDGAAVVIAANTVRVPRKPILTILRQRMVTVSPGRPEYQVFVHQAIIKSRHDAASQTEDVFHRAFLIPNVSIMKLFMTSSCSGLRSKCLLGDEGS